MPDTDTADTAEAMAAVDRLFEELRNKLLLLSHGCARADEGNWDTAERFFSLSKKVDQLRRELSAENARTEQSDDSNSDGRQHRQPVESSTQRRKSKRDYPKYTVRSDVLIKTGLSRD